MAAGRRVLPAADQRRLGRAVRAGGRRRASRWAAVLPRCRGFGRFFFREKRAMICQQADRERHEAERHGAARHPPEPRHLGDDQPKAEHQPQAEDEQRPLGVAHQPAMSSRGAQRRSNPDRVMLGPRGLLRSARNDSRFFRICRLLVALGALHRALDLGALLAALDRRELGGGFRRPRRAAPDLAVIGQRDRAALLWMDAENDLAARRIAVLDRGILGLFLVRLVPAEAVFAGRFIAGEGAVFGRRIVSVLLRAFVGAGLLMAGLRYGCASSRATAARCTAPESSYGEG